MGVCRKVLDKDCEGGHKYTGPGKLKWSCWVISDSAQNRTTSEEPLTRAGEKLTDAFSSPTMVTDEMASSSILGTFTAERTGN